jgi:hypothetical protein
VRLAAILLVAVALSSGCRAGKAQPGDPPAASSGKRDAAALEATVSGRSSEVPKALRCHAAWPMPNLSGSGLPHPQSYDTSDPDVVLDRVTGLSWQRVVMTSVYNHRQAIDYCGGLTLAGRHDWRLPAIIELASISDTSRADPAADPVVFPNTSSLAFWSSQTDITNTGLGWYVFFKTGGVHVGDDVTRFRRVRCVRGPASCTDPEVNPYSVTEDSVHDDRTGLTWQRAFAHDNYVWQDAKTFCSKITSNGGGWRLPSVRELLTLVDVTRFEPSIDSSAFPNTPIEFFWSSSPSLAPAGTAWGVNFTRGSSGAAVVTSQAHVRCVR